ncbi:hypothetical protein LCGC14_1442420 [marine sediment metagenome]|uniref:Uncharacterized protein n=1 Tax=marine sediment metagenome TaxID=412755 RepID=A0A0F9M0T7_9ZZZZ
MNKQWMIASNNVAAQMRDWDGSLARFQYLDLIGLYETSWIVYPHTSDPIRSHREFGYPRQKDLTFR